MISVCMGTYNGGKYVDRQLCSILEQLGPEDEVVISDDSSSDGTLEIIRGLADRRIRLIPGCRFGNPIFNVENALKASRGDPIFLSDQDDVWLPGKVRILKECLERFDLVASDCRVVDGDERVIHDSFFRLRRCRTGLLANLVRNSYLGCCMAFRRTLLERALPFPKDIPMHDIWIGLVAEATGKTHLCPEKLVLYRRHDANISTASGASRFTFLQQLAMRARTLRNLAVRAL